MAIFLKFKTSFALSTKDSAIQSTPNFKANFKSRVEKLKLSLEICIPVISPVSVES